MYLQRKQEFFITFLLIVKRELEKKKKNHINKRIVKGEALRTVIKTPVKNLLQTSVNLIKKGRPKAS